MEQGRDRQDPRGCDACDHAEQAAVVAKATGQQDPVFIDVEAAKQAGHRDLPVPRPSCSASTWRGPTPSPTSRSWVWT
ncbi:FAS1-like dehydratase domain-containing protein [Janibacter sp. G1551]|uniref:FAS1-like dehydratase domain-containing protein n=1 Tax=Janibacter sp. G1551 TaxID=3420440 RepID=UPI003D039C1A